MYEDYYTGHVGGNIPVFRGARYQRGHGLGNVIGGLFRRVVLPFLWTSAVPFLKKEQKDAHQKCVENWNGSGQRRTGRRISEIVREEAQGIKHTAGDVDWQTGYGFRKRRKTRRKRDALS